MSKKVSFLFNRKRIEVLAKECEGINKILGLMFRTKNTEPVFFQFKKSNNLRIHSFFVFFYFIAVWLDDKNKVIEIKKVKPFTPSVRPKRKFSRLLEIPVNSRNKDIVELLVGD